MSVARLSAVNKKNSLFRSKLLSRDTDVGRKARNVLCYATKYKGGDEAVQEIHHLIAPPKSGT